MSNKTKLYRILTAVLLATAFAGSGLTTIGTALSVQVARSVYLTSALSALCCGLVAFSTLTAVLGLAGLGSIAAGYALSHMADLRAIPVFFAAWQGQTNANNDVVTSGVIAFLMVGALLFGVIYFLLLYHNGFTGLAIMLLSSMLVFSHGMSQKASIPAAVPGLVAGATAFALSNVGQRDGFTKVLLPSALAVALALMLMPAARVTWQPMEDLANQVRSMFEQYFNFAHERIAFSISEEGYNHGGEIQGQPVAMLGGPANPDPNAVMRVEADGELLLRGTIRSTYTGYSWVDVTPKSRYLYYDLTHRNVRDRVFNLNFDTGDAFRTVTGQVELIDSATSTLFVPGRLSRFDMDLSNAVYYNSSGEMFMAREAQRGDTYGITSLETVYSEALRQAALRGESARDNQYESILTAHTQLPEGIDRGLYELTQSLIAGSATAYDRAMAIMGHLRRNMRYRLDVEYPPVGRDFASWFVLDSREGYCSYFATAMAVMGRMAGLPTRYVEGYYARPGEDGTVTLTGMDAHAWAEVYFKGLGWVPFDATNGGPGQNGFGGDSEDARYGYGQEDEGQTEETPFEDTSDTLDGEDDEDNTLPPEGDDSDGQDDQQDEEDQDQNDDESDDDNDGETPPEDGETPPDAEDEDAPRDIPWLLIPLLIILLLALLIIWVIRRLRGTDPALLCQSSRRAQQGAMIVYRANLTLLAQMGHFPQTGESPDAFAARVCAELDNPDYADFVKAVSYSRYGGRPIKKESVDVGLRAYRRFLHALRPAERLRFALTRITKGLGDFESIP